MHTAGLPTIVHPSDIQWELTELLLFQTERSQLKWFWASD